LDVRGEEWKVYDFSSYDSVFHVAGIAHNSSDPKLEELYYQVNRDLTIEIANKAKSDSVGQFIYMSSMIVYGNSANGQTKITSDTEPNPDNFYGDSKLQAEKGLLSLESGDFTVAILRPPMIYGENSKGNYTLLSKFAKKTPVFPDYPNKRSMLYIDNLCEFLNVIIHKNESGVFHLHNKELVKTSKMVSSIANKHANKILMTKILNPIIKRFMWIEIIRKVFGDLYYDSTLTTFDSVFYQKIDFETSIANTEKNDYTRERKS